MTKKSCNRSLSRILTADPKNLEGQKFKVLQTICRRGVYEEASLQLRRFFSQLGEGCKVFTEASLQVGRFLSQLGEGCTVYTEASLQVWPGGSSPN